MIVVTAVAFDLASYLSAREFCRMHVGISLTRTNRTDELSKLACGDTLSDRSDNIRSGQGPSDGSWRRGTSRRPCRRRYSGSSVSAKPNTNPAIHALLSKVNMRLRNAALEIRIFQLIINLARVAADPGVKLALSNGRHSRDLFVSRQKLPDSLGLSKGDRRHREQCNEADRKGGPFHASPPD